MPSQLLMKQLRPDGNLSFTGPGYRVRNMLDPILAQDAATKNYVDNLSAGVNVHQAVEVATIVALSTLGTGFSYATTPDNGRVTWVSGPTTIDGYTLAVGNRVLVKNNISNLQNGIYEVISLNQWDRAQDADGTPESEVSAGDLVFVVNGSQASTSWVLLGIPQTSPGVGTLILNTDPIIWTLFASAGVYTASNGIIKVANDFQLNLGGLPTIAITGNDLLPFYDISGTTEGNTTLNDLITAANLVVSTTNGIIVQTAANTFTSRTITGTSGTISVTNGNGVSGNPTLTIDAAYVGQSSITTLGTITTGVWNGTTINVANGGTGATSLTANGILIGNGTSAITSTVLTNGQLLIGSTGNAPVAANIAGTANEITVTNGAGTITLGISANYDGGAAIVTVGTITSGTWNGTIVAPTFGGTGQSAVATGDLLYGSATNVWSRLAAGTNGDVLTLSGGLPIWSASAGDITGVTAGAGLTGGGNSGAVTLDVATGTTGALTVSANSVDVNYNNVNIGVNLSNALEIKSGGITADLLSSTVTPGTPLGNGTTGQSLTSNANGSFSWTSITSASTNAYNNAVAENITDTYGGGIITAATALTDVFGTNNPTAGFEPQISINGLMTGLGNTTSDTLFLSTDGGATAIAWPSATGIEDLIFNATAAGYDLALTDRFRVWFQY